MTRPVYVDRQLSDNTVVVLGGAEARHAVTVRRTRVGEEIDVVNGLGRRATIRVNAMSKDELTGEVLAMSTDPQHSPRITLVQALAKGGRDEQAIETATEFGVDDVIPWAANRSVVRWNDEHKARKGIAKWEASVLAAAKQSRRSWIPQVGEPMNSRQLAAWIGEQVSAGIDVFVCHERATNSIVSKLQRRDCVLIVGPEGGIDDDELAAFTRQGATSVLLAQHVLRSATAGPWAIAAIRSR